MDCGITFSNSSDYKQHKRKHKGGKSHWKDHEQIQHSEKKPYKCKFCDKRYKKMLRCKKHEMKHEKVKSIQCKYCDKNFNKSSDHEKHEISCSAVKPYKCKYCDKSFKKSSNVKQHESIHTGVKPYECKYCDNSFSRSTHCRQHELIHTGVKPYKCEYCDKSFRHSSECNEHKKPTKNCSLISASIVKSVLVGHQTAKDTRTLTKVSNHTSAGIVISALRDRLPAKNMNIHTLEKSLISASIV